jgi:glutamine amidotransferase
MPEFTLTTTQYICPFASSVGNRNVFGVQFHPEKSGAAGLRLLNNFIGMV